MNRLAALIATQRQALDLRAAAAYTQGPASGLAMALRAHVHARGRATASRRCDDELCDDDAAPVILRYPRGRPAYEMSNYSRWVTKLSVSGDGRAIAWDKLDYDTWRIRPAGAKTVSVTFHYLADTLDNGIAWTKPDFLFLNGTNVFMYPEGQPLEYSATVVVHTEPEWNIATGMARAPIASARTFAAANYHDLVDMPFFVGKFDMAARVSREVGPARHISSRIDRRCGSATVNGSNARSRRSRVFGEGENYTVMQIVDSAYGGASGLEHQNSHVDIFAPAYVGSEFQPSLYAHEIFHSWHVKRLRPSEMWPYRYSHPQPTPWLWVSEGLTDYYADLAEVRGGVVDEKGFYALTAEKINEVVSAAPIALEDASLNTWTHPVDGTEYIYYPKGSLAGLLLDIMIRDASQIAKSFDDVMRSLYQSSYNRGLGFTSAGGPPSRPRRTENRLRRSTSGTSTAASRFLWTAFFRWPAPRPSGASSAARRADVAGRRRHSGARDR
jgi:predicted metalloprotease with PDZ domain